MESSLEKKFINAFVAKEKKERLIHEFSNPKKRENALLRFSHGVESVVDNKFIKYRCNINNFSKFLSLFNDVYVISLFKIDGEICSYKEAISHLQEQYMPVIIISDDYVIIKSESNELKDNIFILSK